MAVQKQKFPNPIDLNLIDDLETKYVNKWNQYPASRGKGPATGRAFEEWIIDDLKKAGKNLRKGTMKFQFGKYQVDAAIPDLTNPKTILEIKVYTDLQHSLALGGLIDQMMSPVIKLGLVTMYTPGTVYNLKSSSVISALNNLKARFANRFDYFHIEDGWSREMGRLRNFC